MSEERTPREEYNRKTTQRKKSWSPPSVLPDPEPEEGWVFRWIRTSMIGSPDNTNVSSKFREGWEVVKAESQPSLKILSDQDSRWGSDGAIEVGGLLLCKAPQEMVSQRREYYEEMADQQMNGIDNNFLKENDPRMPVLKPERQTRVTFGSNSKK
jgi:hypothetical protein|tara:strand:- start:959 stop:1423 length:465 start_codon:yes stop_codon:yes gene_type:complete